ncbi:hypothetical protein PUR35_14605, partial [Streptomyces sp. JV184]|nr:hypothetical protein [Streptomyces sp. JV184]
LEDLDARARVELRERVALGGARAERGAEAARVRGPFAAVDQRVGAGAGGRLAAAGAGAGGGVGGRVGRGVPVGQRFWVAVQGGGVPRGEGAWLGTLDLGALDEDGYLT